MKPIIPFISQLGNSQQQQWLKQLKLVLPDETILMADEIDDSEKLKCEIAIIANPSTEVLKIFPNLVWVQSLWAGVENLIETGTKQQFKIARLIDPNLADTMAEAVLSWSLYIHRKMPTYAEQQTRKLWQQLPYSPADQCTIGILGLGELGKAAAIRLVENNFKVLGWSQTHKEIPRVQSYSGEQELADMLAHCQILICLLPLTDKTQKIINKQRLKQLPKGASLINFARGALVNLDDLLSALEQDHLYHAVLDVFETEPLAADSKLWKHPNITVLPHISATTNTETASKIIAENINYYLKTGEQPLTIDRIRGY